MSVVFTIITIIGSLGVFLFGMKLMSESLQKLAGNKMRGILSAITSRRFKGILTGLVITGAVQSSSAITTMVVSFVNAGLLSLGESASVIMGANIGTTVTAWIIAFMGIGKGFSISILGLPLVAISLPLWFSRNDRLKSWSEFIIGLAILFFGLNFMKESIPEINPDSYLVQTLSDYYTSSSFISILIFVFVGLILTLIFQSSSATMALTIFLAVDGWIPFNLAAAMVLGENIGTTGTALLSSIVANRAGRQAAFFHLLFNVIGVLWALILFRPMIMAVEWILQSLPESEIDFFGIALGLAIFHTSFNIMNTLALLGFIPQLLRASGKMAGSSSTREEDFKLTYFDSRFLSTSELSLIQAKKEIILLGKTVHQMFDIVPQLLIEKKPKVYERLLEKIRNLEDKADSMDIEIAAYLTRISEGSLSKKSSVQLRNMLRISKELESIGDSCNKMALSINLKNQQKLYFIQELRDNLKEIFSLAEAAISEMNKNLKSDYRLVDLENAISIEKRLDECRDRLMEKHIESTKSKEYNFATGLVYTELIGQTEKIGDYALNISEAISGKKENELLNESFMAAE